MWGLFEEDLRMIMQRKKVFIIFVLLAVFIGYSQVSPEFVLGYIPMLTIIVIVGTISYDEYDNGYRFLMTLPIDAKMYVLEKYIFFIAGTITSWVEAFIIYFGIMIVKNQTISISGEGEVMFVSLIVVLLFVACIIPVHIKYGVEKSKIALIIFIGTVAVVFYCIRKIIGMDRLIKISAFLDNVNIAMLILVGIIFTVILLFISYIISYSVMRKKEF